MGKSSVSGTVRGLPLIARPFPSAPQTLRRSRLQRPGVPDRLNGHDWAASGRLQHLATGRSTRRRAGLQTQVREDLLDDGLLQDRRDDLALTAALRAVLHVELKDAVDPGHVRINN